MPIKSLNFTNITCWSFISNKPKVFPSWPVDKVGQRPTYLNLSSLSVSINQEKYTYATIMNLYASFHPGFKPEYQCWNNLNRTFQLTFKLLALTSRVTKLGTLVTWDQDDNTCLTLLMVPCSIDKLIAENGPTREKDHQFDWTGYCQTINILLFVCSKDIVSESVKLESSVTRWLDYFSIFGH